MRTQPRGDDGGYIELAVKIIYGHPPRSRHLQRLRGCGLPPCAIFDFLPRVRFLKGKGAVAVTWTDLTDDERTALKRMNRGPYPQLSTDLARRLISLGLAVERPSGVGISRDGRDLVINALLAARTKFS